MKTFNAALIVLSVVLLLSACQFFSPKPGIGKAVSWSSLPNWKGDNLSQAWPAIQAQCPKISLNQESWVEICQQAASLTAPSSDDVRDFLQTYFKPHKIHGSYGKPEGLITGYYEPILNGSSTRSDKYAYPVYARPTDMLTIDLAELYPSLKGMRLRGRLEGNRVVPFHAREVIDGEQRPLSGQELLWIDDPYGSFFVQIQGSGKVRLEDGTMMGLDYADQNGHPYFAIGKKLVEIGALELANVSLFTIRQWLRDNPSRAVEILNSNPSYVFFNLREETEQGPRGSLNVPLTASRSLAVDKRVIPLGTPVWLVTTLPDDSEYRRLMLAQDTGGAIAGPVRADVFFGTGEQAEKLAGEMKQRGTMYALLPIDR